MSEPDGGAVNWYTQEQVDQLCAASVAAVEAARRRQIEELREQVHASAHMIGSLQLALRQLIALWDGEQISNPAMQEAFDAVRMHLLVR